MSKSGIFGILAILGLFLSLWFVISQLGDWRPLIITVAVLVGTLLALRMIGLERLVVTIYAVINRFRPWHKLPALIGTLNLDAKRIVLRQKNLYDTPARKDLPPPEWSPEVASQRTADGSFNDLSDPNMGRAGMRFGRNVPLHKTWPEAEPDLMRPSPREISQKLMTREVFEPASILNLNAASWIQFMVHGWVSHEREQKRFFELQLNDGDKWHENPMRIKKTKKSSEATDRYPPTYANTESHWWDASQIYGSDKVRQEPLRTFTNGRLKIEGPNAFGDFTLPPNLETEKMPGIDQTGFFDNYWIGLSMLHTLFTREHNAICERLQNDYPTWNDDKLFATARLINAALLAKIHTVEWTPGILAHPALQISMDANWWGLFGERFKKAFGRIGDREEVSGIIGSPADHHSASFSMTEEFTAIYRLHPLLPDAFDFYSAANGEKIKRLDLVDVQGNQTRPSMADLSQADLFYSFGIQHPGALRLHNYPRLLQQLTRIDGEIIDLAAIDILRDRERGVPRYNEYRRLCHMKPMKNFKQLTDNPEWAEQIEAVYEGDIERVDLMVGMMAEPLPQGFGFSDTRFRIFILMASRRLKSDRFFTNDYIPEVYTQQGLDWIDNNTFSSVLLRHYPQLAPALKNVPNSFAPWNPLQQTKPVQ